jgi:hypothetical protein
MGAVAQLLKSELFWLAIAAIAQILIVFSIPTSIWLYWREERRSNEALQKQERSARKRFEREERDKFYVQLDEMYLRILQMVVQNPQVGRVSLKRTENEQVQYDAFAFIMWNFIESIYDFCIADETLRKTWHPIMEAESVAHAEWFSRPENRKRFKGEFCNYIDGLLEEGQAGVQNGLGG